MLNETQKPNGNIVSQSRPHKNLQMVRFDKAVEFHCSRCDSDKKAKNVAYVDGDWAKKLCNGCYGHMVAFGN